MSARFLLKVDDQPALTITIEQGSSRIDTVDQALLARVLPRTVVARSATQLAFWARYFGRMVGTGGDWRSATPLLVLAGRPTPWGRVEIGVETALTAPAWTPSFHPAIDVAPSFCRSEGNRLWLSRDPFDQSSHPEHLRLMASTLAERCGIAVTPLAADGPRTLVLTRPDLIASPEGWSKLPFIDAVQAVEGARGLREQDGGPSLAQCFTLIDELCAVPAADTLKLLRWVVYSVMTGNNHIHAGHIGFLDKGHGWELAPFAFLNLLPDVQVPAGAQVHGMMIGGEYGSEWLRADHWIRLAQYARVKPKVVFTLMRTMAKQLPVMLDAVMIERYGALPTRGVPYQVVRAIRAKAQRMGELAAAAAHAGVAGLNSKIRPTAQKETALAPLPETLRRYPTAVSDD